MKKSTLLFLPLLLSVSSTAMAAATAEEATRLAGVFQSYLGNEPGVVTVEAEGDDYIATFDVAPLAKKYSANGETMTMSPFELTLTSKGDGQWDVSHSGPFNFVVKAPNTLSLDFKTESYETEGVFDENLMTFLSNSSTIKNMSLVEEIIDASQNKTSVDISIANLTSEQAGAANANGGVDLATKYKFDGLSEKISAGATAGGMNVEITAEDGSYDTTGTGFKSKSIFDLISFFVTHQDKDSIVKDQAALKTILNDGLPLFENVTSTGTINKVSVTTPIGPIGMDSIAISVDGNGIVEDGKLRESISVSGLAIPQAIVPPWAVTLVPKNFTFDFSGSDFNLLAPAKLILENLDLAKEPPIPDGLEATLMPMFLPKGAATITLHPTSINNDLYSFSAEGNMVAGPASMPSGQAKVKAKGLDEIMKVLQSAPPEMGLQSYGAMIIAAKGLGKAESDGSLSYDIATTPEGKVTVNGIDPMKLQ
jgi:hypothetical protein